MSDPQWVAVFSGRLHGRALRFVPFPARIAFLVRASFRPAQIDAPFPSDRERLDVEVTAAPMRASVRKKLPEELLPALSVSDAAVTSLDSNARDAHTPGARPKLLRPHRPRLIIRDERLGCEPALPVGRSDA